MPSRAHSLLAIVAAAALAAELAAVAWWPQALLQAVIFAWFAWPGVVLARRIFAGPAGGDPWLVGPLAGVGLSTVGLLALWAVGVQGWPALVLGPVPVWLLAWRTPSGLRDIVTPVGTGRRDVAALSCLVLVVVAVTWVPYAHVGATLPGGTAYRAYFTADFVWAMSVSAELAKGAVPPLNPFLSGAGLHYYWLSHLLSGAVYQNVAGWGVRLEDVILVDGIGFGTCFVACLYWLVRACGVSPVAAGAGAVAGFAFNSYEGLERLLVVYERHLNLGVLREINIDAVTRWFYAGMPVDGLQRLLLYQPHHLTGYVFALLAIWVVARAPRVASAGVAVTAGSLLGLGFLFSTFTAIIAGVVTAVLYAGRLVGRAGWRAILECALVGAAPVSVAVALSSMLGYVDPAHGSLFVVGVNPVALHHWSLVLLLSFGPLLLVGVGGGVTALRARQAEAWPAVVLVAVSFLFYFIVDVRDMGGVWVGWRTGHLILIGCAALSGVALDGLARVHRPWRIAGMVGLGILMLLALPTTVIDVYNAQDITNRAVTATFPWTLVITPGEREALDWIRRETPPDAIVQVEPRVRDAGTWAYIPAFAERRMAAGLPISMIPLLPYQLASDNVQFGVFGASSAIDARDMAAFLGIDYLVVGPPERRRYPEVAAMFAASPALFRPVFSNTAVTVYEVARR